MANLNKKISGRGMVDKSDTFIFPADSDIQGSDIAGFIMYNDNKAAQYNKYYRYYIGDHDILHEEKKKKKADNKIVSNYASYIIDTFVGFFVGQPPQITLENDNDDELLQSWANENSLQDQLSELAKQVDIYGRSYLFLYCVDGEYKLTVCDPLNSFMIYDDTVEHKAVGFVRYQYGSDNQLKGWLYTENAIREIDSSYNLGPEEVNPIQAVPSFEFYSNEERTSMVGKIITLLDAYDHALSQKANQNEYFDNAYLTILGVPLKKDRKTGDPILNLDGNNIIHAPSLPEGAPAKPIDFLQKPDGDNLQENLLNRLSNDIYQTAMVPNLTDERFGNNLSGIAIQYKMQPMINLASVKERKFTRGLRKMFRVLFEHGNVLPATAKDDVFKDIRFKFIRNMPTNLTEQAQTATMLSNIVSRETLLGTLSIVDNPKAEIERIDKDEQEQMQHRIDNAPDLPDYMKVEDDKEVDNAEDTSKQEE